jgi:tetratricopeptide (TPR) repeat protein
MPIGFRDDYSAYFTECLVRAVELRVQRLKPEQVAQELNRADADGFVLIRPLQAALAKFEASEPPMNQYFPDLIRSIDVNAERKRVQSIAFAPVGGAQSAEDAHAERTGHEAATPASSVDAALAEGERQIAAQNAPAAAAAFERVLAAQPGQPRALYGLAIASLLQGNATHARELFEQVVTGASSAPSGNGPAAHSDPVALAWSHVYLGRMHDLDGDRDEALADYNAALAVLGVPDEARSAAQHGIEQSYQLAAPSPSPG